MKKRKWSNLYIQVAIKPLIGLEETNDNLLKSRNNELKNQINSIKFIIISTAPIRVNAEEIFQLSLSSLSSCKITPSPPKMEAVTEKIVMGIAYIIL